MSYRNNRSVVYRAERSGPGKWIFALIVFILAMTLTWAEVDGINIPTPALDSSKVKTNTTQTNGPSEGLAPSNTPEEPSTPSPLPEPTTILLLGAGVGAAYLMRKKIVHR